MKISQILLAAVFLSAMLAFKCEDMKVPANDYPKQWAEIDSLEAKGLPRSALTKVSALYELAKREENQPQIIKALIYRNKFTMEIEEDATARAIIRMEKEVEQEASPIREVLQSMLAELYYDYLQRNRYRFANRTDIQGENPEDIRTWSVQKLHEKSAELYLESIANTEIGRYNLTDFSAILHEYDVSTRSYVGNLYEFLMYRAIQHFSSQNALIHETVSKFNLHEAEAFAPLSTFVRHAFSAQDSQSQVFVALGITQQWLKHYRKTRNRSGLAMADIQRIRFAYEHSTHPEKDSLYLAALDRLIDDYDELYETGYAYFDKATYYTNRGRRYDQDSNPRFQADRKHAEAICLEAIDKYPNSMAAHQCKRLLEGLRTKSLRFQVEEVNVIDRPLRVLMTYRNVFDIHFRLIKLSAADRDRLQHMQRDERAAFFQSLKPMRAWEVSLPDPQDLNQHRTELPIDGLESGIYLLLASDSPTFTDEGHAVAFGLFHVSNLAYAFVNESRRGRIVVTDRRSGKAIRGAHITWYTHDYDHGIRRRLFVKFGESITDSDGMAMVESGKSRSVTPVIVYGNDRLDLRAHYGLHNASGSHGRRVVHFFTDRSIYRPGQLIYFKGLALDMDENSIPSVSAHRSMRVRFKDANYQEIGHLDVTTNAYGSFNGSFEAPAQGLTGRMTMMIEQMGSHSIRVEEYKRPKFEVSLDPVTKTYVLGDRVEVAGVARMYAGSVVDGAQMHYRVVRRRRMPRYGYYDYWRPWPRVSEETEITNGYDRTGDDGRFSVSFDAIGDPAAPKEAFFEFEILVDVTDINGESRSSSTIVRLGNSAFRWRFDLVDRINPAALDSTKIYAENWQGEKVSAYGELTVYKLKEPSSIYRHRYWEKADTMMLDRAEYRSLFPSDPYDNDHLWSTWAIDKEAYKQVIDLDRNDEASFNEFLQPGVYRFELSGTDSLGRAVEATRYSAVFDHRSAGYPNSHVLFLDVDGERAQPGDVVRIQLGSPLPELHVLMEVEKDERIVRREWINLRGQHELSVDVDEADRGNFFIHFSYIYDNRRYTEQRTIQVPWDHKDLNIELASFRSVIEPGASETWQIRITGKKKDQIAAEVLASMYDASLDALYPHQWQKTFYPTRYSRVRWQIHGFSARPSNLASRNWNLRSNALPFPRFPELNWFGLKERASGWRGMMMKSRRIQDMSTRMQNGMITPSSAAGIEAEMDGVAIEESESVAFADESANTTESKESDAGQSKTPPPLRRNLKETVFFYPTLKTDNEGAVILSFKMNEALTRWKLQLFAHTKDFAYGFSEHEVVTQKDLMVFPNPPRFLRQGDRIDFSAKISNVSDRALIGRARIEWLDARTMQSIAAKFGIKSPSVDFTVDSGKSTAVSWEIHVPKEQLGTITYRIVAETDGFSDGEENILPVLTNRIFVTETLPMHVRGGEKKTFDFEAMRSSMRSTTLTAHRLTLEYTSNPVWYAVLALPYIMDYPHTCTEQIINRYYANALAANIVDRYPKIQRVFESWASGDKDVLLSNLEKNEALKSALLEETPWVLQAQDEREQRRRIALLFDMNQMGYGAQGALRMIIERQSPNGGFSWFPGGPDHVYVTQYVLESLGHLAKLGVWDWQKDTRVRQVVMNAVSYVDQRLVERYNRLKRSVAYDNGDMEADHLDGLTTHYLYVRSFFDQLPLDAKVQEAHSYYLGQAEKHWMNKGIYVQGMLALALHRYAQGDAAPDVMASIIERSIRHEELGMYWKTTRGYHWYQLPIETQALLIEAMAEIVPSDRRSIDDMRIWLLKHKQTNRWKTTKATAAAIYALLVTGDGSTGKASDWLSEDPQIRIDIGSQTFDTRKMDVEAGLGYFTKHWDGADIEGDQAKIEVRNDNSNVSWGGAYWQYFEDMDKVDVFEDTPLQLRKSVYKVVDSDRGEVLREIDDENALQVGDKLKVRVEIRVDRPMEFVHMKDMRASGFEPISVLSGYRWQGGLGYYESTKDLATHFFFSRLPSGTHVVEYELRVSHAGRFSNGITTIQSMYAPEFSSHSAGDVFEIQAQ